MLRVLRWNQIVKGMDMTKNEAALRAIEALNEVCRRTESSSRDPESGQRELLAQSLDAEQCFGKPHARLFPYLGRKVRTPAGPGVLLQVFADRVTVLLDSELNRSSFFQPAEIEPVTWEVP
jgi:hypothetical protein